MNKFITPVAMKVTKEQYEKDLKEFLIKLGYQNTELWSSTDFTLYDYLTTNYSISALKSCIGTYNYNLFSKELNECYIIDHYNPELFLALAAMTETETPIIGEYVITNGYSYNYDGRLLRVRDIKFDCNDTYIYFSVVDSGYFEKSHNFNLNGNTKCRKATKEELIQHFTKQSKTMINYTIPGTLLPEIPENTKFRVVYWKDTELDHNSNFHKKGCFIFYGTKTHNGEIYILADIPNYTGENYWMFKLTDLNKLTKQENMNKKIIGYKLVKPEYEETAMYIAEIKNEGWAKQVEGYSKGESVIHNNSRAKERLEKAKVLDLWFEPIYEEEFKIDDWVVVTQEYKGNEAINGMIGQLKKVDNRSDIKYCIYNNPSLTNYSWCINVRKATPEEIEQATSKTIIMSGDFKLTIKNNTVYHNTENITRYVKAVETWYNTIPEFFGSYSFNIDTITLSRTGCRNEKTTVKQWLDIAKMIS